jgi:hypothetical protein
LNEQIEYLLKVAAMYKWLLGEPMSLQDMKRLTDVIGNHPLSISDPTQEEMQGIKAELLNILQQRFFAQPQQPE